MGSLIDSSVIISAERGTLDWNQLTASLAGDPLAIASITASELLHGVHRATESRRETRRAFVESILAAVDIIPLIFRRRANTPESQQYSRPPDSQSERTTS